MTFRDFAAECENYGHSQEYLESVKELCEIKVLDQYIENQLFMQENYEELEFGDAQFTEGYFAESTDIESIQALMEKAEEKKEKWYIRFWNWIKRTLSRFAQWLLKKADSNAKVLTEEDYNRLTTAKDEELAELAKKVKELEKTKGIVAEAARGHYDRAESLAKAANTNYARSQALEGENKSLQDEIKNLKNNISTLQKNNKELRIKVLNGKKVVSVEVLEEVVAMAVDGSNNGRPEKIIQAKEILDKAINEAGKNGIVVPIDSERIKVTAKKINELAEKAGAMINKANAENAAKAKMDEIDAAAKKEARKTNPAYLLPDKELEKLNEFNKDLGEGIGGAIKAYQYIDEYLQLLYDAAKLAGNKKNQRTVKATAKAYNVALKEGYDEYDDFDDLEDFEESKYSHYKKAHDSGDVGVKPSNPGSDLSTNKGKSWSKNELNTPLLSRKEFKEIRKANKENIDKLYNDYKALYKDVVAKEGKKAAGKPLSKSEFYGIMVNGAQARGGMIDAGSC